jgi:hypothetical protein
MKTQLFAGLVAIALASLPVQAAAQGVSESVGGSIGSVGGVTSINVFLGGTGTASVSLTQQPSSFMQMGNAPGVMTGGGFATSGTLNVAPGVNGFVGVQRTVAPAPAAPVVIDNRSGFNVSQTPGSVSAIARSSNTFQMPAIQAPVFSSGFQAPSFGGGFQIPSFNMGGGFFSN